MEEHNGPASDGDIGSLSPKSPSPPILPLQAAQQAQRITNFFIDNILRPDFGCRKEVRNKDRAQMSRLGASIIKKSSGDLSGDISGDISGDTRGPPATRGDSRDGGHAGGEGKPPKSEQPLLWPAWVYCTRYSDRPSSGPRTRKLKKSKSEREDKRPRTAFTSEQLHRLKAEFQCCRYISEQQRQTLSRELSLSEAQIKIWFQNKRAKVKKASGCKDGLAAQLMAQGLYNHSTCSVQDGDSD